ncbi:pilus assembly protein PilX [Pseudomonas sp. F1_0610]|uniref:pilus assembly protein PilX n=1 Tax=Pseudomonas sp. F1_0610 TaxID=3114284 RepID=UPI0039C19CA7
MNKAYHKGVSLFVVIVILLLVSLTVISGMSSFLLEQKVTNDRVEFEKMIDIANSSLREAEFRFYGPSYLRDKIDIPASKEFSHCRKDNTLKDGYLNKPCLLTEMTDNELAEYYLNPISFLINNSNRFGVAEVDAIDHADNMRNIAWMPYVGTDPLHLYDPIDSSKVAYKGYWNAYLVKSNEDDDANVNPEYGASLEGKGTYYYLITGQSNGQVAVQSTLSNVYVGINN